MREPIRIGILNEDEVVRNGLCSVLGGQSDIIIIGSYQYTNDALYVARQGGMDLLLMDYTLAEGDAIGLIVSLNKECPDLRILISVGARQAITASLLLTLGGRGVICKGQSILRYLEAVRSLVLGELYVCSCLTLITSPWQWIRVGLNLAKDDQEVILDNPLLSLREREVMRLYISGMKVTQIALELERSLKTISAQKLSALRKLGIKSDAELFRVILSQAQSQ